MAEVVFTKEEWAAWKTHPCTLAIREILLEDIRARQEEWVDGLYGAEEEIVARAKAQAAKELSYLLRASSQQIAEQLGWRCDDEE